MKKIYKAVLAMILVLILSFESAPSFLADVTGNSAQETATEAGTGGSALPESGGTDNIYAGNAAAVGAGEKAAAETDASGEENGTDGIYIRELSTALFSGAEEQDDGTYLWRLQNSEAGHVFGFRINFSISGKGEAAADAIAFRVPKSVLKDRDGNAADSVSWSIPSRSEIEAAKDENGNISGNIGSDVNYAWYEDGDDYVIYNFRPVPAGDNGYIELSYAASKTSFSYKDGDQMNPFTCEMQIGDGAAENTKKTAEPITITVDTGAELVSTEKQASLSGREMAWDDAWGNSVKPENPKDYAYLLWTVKSGVSATQPYNFSITDDTMKGNHDTDSSRMTVLGIRYSGEKEFTASHTAENQTLTGTRYDTVLTAIPLTAYQNETYWKAENTETAKVNPADGKDAATEKRALAAWEWTKPTFAEPGGHFSAGKIGDEAYRNGVKARPASDTRDFKNGTYSRYDLEKFTGYTGEEGEETAASLDEYDGFDFALWLSGYPLPWTKDTAAEEANADGSAVMAEDGGMTDSGDKKESGSAAGTGAADASAGTTEHTAALENAGTSGDGASDAETADKPWTAYGKRPVRYILSDEGIYLLNDPAALLSSDRSAARTIANGGIDKDNAILLTKDDFRIDKIEYSWRMQDASYDSEETGSWITRRADYTDRDILYFEGKFDGSDSWTSFASYNIKTGTAAPDSSFVASMDGKKVTLKAGADLTAFRIVCANAHYSTEICAVPFLTLKNSESVKKLLKEKKQLVLVNNSVGRVDALRESSTWDGGKEELLSDTIWTKQAEMRVSDADYAVASVRESSLRKNVVSTSNNTRRRFYTITWSLDQEETVTSETGTAYIPQDGGTFYDLLPQGSVFVPDSLAVRGAGGALESSSFTARTISNYKGSGRIMLIIDVQAEEDYYRVTFDTRHAWNAISDYGTEVKNPLAYETGNASITNGRPDDGGNLDGEVRTYMADLSLGTGVTEETETGNRFLYAERTWDISALTSASSGLTKKVKADTEYAYETGVHIRGGYSYELRYLNSTASDAKNLVFFDSLENYDPDAKNNDGQKTDWRGVLQSIDTSQIASRGASPAVYISKNENLDLEQEGNRNLADSAVWTKVTQGTDLSGARAIAIDLSKKEDGTDFTLPAGSSVVTYLYMQAPAAAPDARNGAGYPYTYNNIYISDHVEGGEGETGQDFLIHQDYTKVSLAVSGDVRVNKISAATERGISGISFRLFGTSDYGTAVDETKKSGRDGSIAFEDVEKGSYILQETDSTDDFLADPAEHSVTIDGIGKTMIDGADYTGSAITIENTPRVHADVSFSKRDANFTGQRIAGAMYRLSGRSDYGADVLMTAESLTDEEGGTAAVGSSGLTVQKKGLVIFENVEKGTYHLKEIKAPEGYALDETTYTVTVDGDGNVTIAAESDGETAGSVQKDGLDMYYLTDEPLHYITFTKKSSYDGAAVGGAEFSLKGTADSGAAVDAAAVSDADTGTVRFTGLESGTYVLMETKAAEGYEKDDAGYPVRVNTEGTFEIGGLSKTDSVYDFYNAKTSDQQVIVKKVWNDGNSSHDPSELVVTIDTSVPEASLRTYTIVYDANGGSFGDGTTNTVTYNAKNEVTSGTVGEPAPPDETKGFVGWATKKNATKADFSPSPNDITNPAMNAIGEGEIKTVYAVWKELQPARMNLSTNSQYYENSLKNIVDKDVKYFSMATGEEYQAAVKNGREIVRLDDNTAFYNSNFAPLYGWKDGDHAYWYSAFHSVTLSGTSRVHPNNGWKNWLFPGVCGYYLENIRLDGLDFSRLIRMNSLFEACGSVKTIDLSGLPTSQVTDMDEMFYGCNSLESLDLSGFNTAKVTRMSSMFGNCYALQSLDLGSFNTANVTNMYYMFDYCKTLSTLDLSCFDTKKVTRLDGMFRHCESLKTLDLGSFNTAKVTQMSELFYGCKALTSVNVSSFNTSKVTAMNRMFMDCASLETLALENFDTSKVKNMGYLFSGCSSLRSLDLSHFNTGNVTTMASMFYECRDLETLDLSGFALEKVKNTGSMFYGCKNLKMITVKGCSDATVSKIETALTQAGIRDQVTLVKA